jgi:hypothetical protein
MHDPGRLDVAFYALRDYFLLIQLWGLSNVGEERSKTSAPAESYVISTSYTGPERRLRERREYDDRRGESRLEGKLPRRSGKGRRKGERLGLFLRDLAEG